MDQGGPAGRGASTGDHCRDRGDIYGRVYRFGLRLVGSWASQARVLADSAGQKYKVFGGDADDDLIDGMLVSNRFRRAGRRRGGRWSHNGPS